MKPYMLDWAWPVSLGGRLDPSHDRTWIPVWRGIAREDLDFEMGSGICDRNSGIRDVLQTLISRNEIREYGEIATFPHGASGGARLAIKVVPSPDPVRGIASTRDEHMRLEFPFEMLTSDFLKVWEVLES